MRVIRNTIQLMERSPGPAVEARGLELAYDGQVVLSPSDFEIPSGRLTALIGPNGAGKSTLLHAIAGILQPRRGRLQVLGTDAGSARRRVAYVFQAAKVNDALPVTVGEVVAMGRYSCRGAFGRFGPSDRRAVTDVLERLRIADLRHRHLRELSGGQRQRVFVAQGLAQEAELLLLDEPVTGLDIPTHERIDEAIEAEVARGTTVVVTTHDLGESRRADHVLLLAGRVVAAGPPDAALADDKLSEAYGGHLLHFEEGRAILDDAAHGLDGADDSH